MPVEGTLDSIAEDIVTMRVRGAAEIGRHAARGLAAWERDLPADAVPDVKAFDEAFRKATKRVVETRPTAVTIRSAVRFVTGRVHERGTVAAKRDALRAAVAEFEQRSKAALAAIGQHASKLVKDGGVYLTHCNSQAAIAGFKEARKAGVSFEVIACETRPWRQGLITARQLAEAGVATSFIVDSAALHELPRVDAVFVGCDTIAANGDVVNKVGTSTLALACREMKTPFRVCGETFKVDPDTPSGAEVVIEEREVAEVANPAEIPGVRILNPVFDVTPAAWVTEIVTELGPVPPRDVLAAARKAWS